MACCRSAHNTDGLRLLGGCLLLLLLLPWCAALACQAACVVAWGCVPVPRSCIPSPQPCTTNMPIPRSCLGAEADAPSRRLRTKAAGEEVVRSELGPISTIFKPAVMTGTEDRLFNM